MPAWDDLPPIVLAHGWGGSPAIDWPEDGLRKDLEVQGRPVVAPPLPGHRREPSPTDPEAYRDLAKLFADSLHVERFDGVGYSLGGKLLLEIAAREPRRVRRLVIVGVGGNLFRGENGNAVADALAHSANSQTAPAIRQVVDMALASGNDPSAMAAVIRRPTTPISPADLAEVSAEVLLLAGGRDRIGHSPEELVDALPHAHLAILPDLDHGQLRRSAQVSALASAFLIAP